MYTAGMFFKSLLASLLCFCWLGGDYKFEGVYPHPDGERRFFLVAFYLPYNPTIWISDPTPSKIAACAKWWPHGKVVTHSSCDFAWVEGDEVEILEQLSLAHISVIYTTTHHDSCERLKRFLDFHGFNLLSHWYWEGKDGHAIFLKKEIFTTAMKSLNYPGQSSGPSIGCFPPAPLEVFLKKPLDKSSEHSVDPIDFIYMINLDERPEKFQLSAANFNLCGITPYRFSAVNGWNLPTSTLRELGLKFSHSLNQEKFMGSVFKKVESYSNEMIEKVGETYFALGMSRGAIGIVLSHLSVLQDAYDSGYKTIWVMEDDAEILADPWQIPGLIQKLDQLDHDWDILFTDTDTKDTEGRHVPCRALAARPNFSVPPLTTFFEKFYAVGNDFSRTGMRYGAYSMVVRRSGMKKILEHFKTYGIFLPYDMDYWLAPDLRMYGPNKDIVSHRVGAPSDNSEPAFRAERTESSPIKQR
ncbi:MAG: glycosyltransferase family 25 protein [Thermodesulfobacteriota bacterium]